MATLPETEQRQYADRDLSLRYLGLIEGRQKQRSKRLEYLIETVRDLDRKIDRYFLILLTAMLALLSITVGGFIALANLIVTRIPGG